MKRLDSRNISHDDLGVPDSLVNVYAGTKAATQYQSNSIQMYEDLQVNELIKLLRKKEGKVPMGLPISARLKSLFYLTTMGT